MYEKGMVKISQEEEWGGWPYADPGNAYLPHSCNEWEIGGEAEIEAMIADLQGILAVMRSPDYVKPVREEDEPVPLPPPRERTPEEKAAFAKYRAEGYSALMAASLVAIESSQKFVADYYNEPSPLFERFRKEK